MARVYNFSAGPAVLPEEVLQEAADEMLDYRGTGMSVMEMSHRSKAYDTIIKEAEADLRELMNIPDNYKVLFLQGGASQQFAMIPMNLMKNRVADYIVTGQWAKKAYQEASLYGKANKIASSEDKTFSYIPDCSDLPISEDADYVYICENNTIYGTKFKTLPNTKGKPLVADVSSCFLSEPVDVTKYGVIYGGVQKNIGPAGVVIVIIREDLITEDVLPGTPTMLRYKIHADADSLYNTPPAYGIYICGKVFKWLKKMGGLEAMKERNEKKAKILYDYLDESKLFKGTVRKEDRSLMNVPFITGNEELDAKFVKEAKEAGFENLKGHRTVGGMRASIYNAMPIEGVEKLVEFMKKFEAENTLQTTQTTASVYDASIAEIEIRLAKLEKDRQRYENLVNRKAATPIQLEQIETEYKATYKKLEAVKRQQKAALSGVNEVSYRRESTEAAIQRTTAALEMARLNLSYTVVIAPCDGKLGRRTLEEGQFITAGQTITYILPDTQKWIVANYKETQIENLCVGQEVTITVDAISKKEFTGKITAISGATGSKYSLVPTDNSAGNFVKIQQRIPVRIDFTHLSAEDNERLAAGMMAVVKAKL